jgi:apolipoprotein D and lipocalin family protein
MRIRSIALLTVLIAAATGLMLADTLPPLQTVRHVDLNRYIGKWFEIARYPNIFERKCDHDVTAEYSIKANGSIRVVNSCVRGDGRIDRSEGTAHVVDTLTNAKLKVTFFWPFYGKYWIIGLDNQYQYAVVGEPSHEYVWILSRTPTLPDNVYQKVLQQVTTSGYEPQKLAKTTQTATLMP